VRALVLSDLHLGPARTATDDAFISFVEQLTEGARRDGRPLQLVLLGDFLDLLHAPASARDPLAALDAVAARHRSALAALGVAAANGVVVNIVPGNHDSELVEPDLQEHLRTLVADAAGTSPARLRSNFRIRPWFLLVPGLLYAEHGSQYHALNAVADPLAPFGRWSGRLPLGAVLDGLSCETEHRGRARALPNVLPPALRALAQRGRTDPSTAASLHACAREAGLSAEAPAALRRLADDSWTALLRNARAAVLGRTGYVESRQQLAVAAIHEILEREGKGAPVYVFGHTHHIGYRAIHSDGAPAPLVQRRRVGQRWLRLPRSERTGRLRRRPSLPVGPRRAVRARGEWSAPSAVRRRSGPCANDPCTQSREHVGRPGGEPVTVRPGSRGGAIGHAELSVDVGEVEFDRRLADPEHPGHLGVRAAPGDEAEDLELTLRQCLLWTALGRSAARRSEEVDRPFERQTDRAAYVLLRQRLEDVSGSPRLEHPTNPDGVRAARADENDGLLCGGSRSANVLGLLRAVGVLQREHEESRALVDEDVERRPRIVQLRRHLDAELTQDAFERVEPDRLLVEEECASWLRQNCHLRWGKPWGNPWGSLGERM